MKTVSLMELRRHPGELVDEVRLKGESIVLERSGRPVAMLTPPPGPDGGSPSSTNRVRQRLSLLAAARSMGADRPRAADLDAWLRGEREAWR